MESTQHRLREYDEALATTMSSLVSRERGSVLRRIGHTGPQRHVPGAIRFNALAIL
jgi:hypothetical protein